MPNSFPEGFFEGAAPVAVVASGASFVGSHLINDLLKKSVKVICLDSLHGTQGNAEHFLENKNFFLLTPDTNTNLLSQIPNINYIFCLEEIYEKCKDLLDLAAKHKSRFLLVSTIFQTEDKKSSEALAIEYGGKRNVDIRVVRLGDVYGPAMVLSSGNYFSRLLKQAFDRQPLEIAGASDLSLFPVYIDDVVDGIEKSLFSAGTKNSTIVLAGPRTTVFDVAQKIKEVAREGEVKFVKESHLTREDPGDEILYSGRKLISWNPAVSLEGGILKTLNWFSQNPQKGMGVVGGVGETKAPSIGEVGDFWEEKKTTTKGAETNKEIHGQRVSFGFIRSQALLILAFLFFFVFVLVFVKPFVQAAVGFAELSFAKKYLLKGESKKTQTLAQGAAFWFDGSKSGFVFWENIPGLGNLSSQAATQTKILSDLARVTQTSAIVLDKGEILLKQVMGDEAFDTKPQIEDLALDLNSLDRQLSFLETEIGDGSKNKLFEDLDIPVLRKTVTSSASLLPELPELLGIDGKKTYLILFQNNAELRPTGGFIGSFALVTFDSGRLINMEVQDVYSADGQLKGHVEPPDPIKKYLGEANWFLRDSNWSPDFPTSAQRAGWFLDKELGQKVDGVLAVDLEFAKLLLSGIGELELPDFGESVNKDNLYEKAQQQAEGDFFPGSRAKKDFLTALSRGLLNHFKTSASKNLPAVAKAVVLSFEGRHSAFWTSREQTNNILRLAGWDGAIEKVSCRPEQTNCSSDYLQVVEANLGVNKSNYFLDRSYSLDVSLAQEAILHKLTISYKNRSQAGVWPGGDYKNYLRIFVPQGATGVQAVVVDPSTNIQEELGIENDTEGTKSVFGMLVLVPAGEWRNLIVSWETPGLFAPNGELVFLWQKQMGTIEDSVDLQIRLPGDFYKVLGFPSPSLTTQEVVRYNTNLARDLLVNLIWQSKF